MAKVVEDTVSVTITDTNDVESEPRAIPGASWLKWSFHVYPLGKNHESACIGIYIRIVGGRANVNSKFHIRESHDNNDYRCPFIHEFNDGEEHGLSAWHLNEDIKNGTTSKRHPWIVNCTATFVVHGINLVPIMLHELIDESKPHCTDARVTIGMDEIKVQRGFLSMISPVGHTEVEPPFLM